MPEHKDGQGIIVVLLMKGETLSFPKRACFAMLTAITNLIKLVA